MDGERSDLIVRTLTADDCARLVAMDERVTGRGRREWYAGKLRRALEDTDVCISLGAELAGAEQAGAGKAGLLVGAVMGSVRFGEFGVPEPVAILDTVLVDPAFARTGIATALLDQLLDNLRGLRIARLRTEVAWDEIDLLAFFAKAGFAPAPRLVLERDVTAERVPAAP